MLKVGDAAPEFALESAGGGKVSLKDFSGRTLVIYFYPKDDTPGCTVEAKEFSAALAAFEAAGAAVVGVSRDTIASHCKFREKYQLSVALLSDPDLAVHRAYGAFGEKTLYGKKTEGVIRSTFIIDGAGRVAKVYPSVKVAGHVEKVLAQIAPATEPPAATPAPEKKTTAKSAPEKKTAAKKTTAKKTTS